MTSILLSSPVQTTVVVRPNDFDQLGHVNNSVVLEYLECGRIDWARRQQNLGDPNVVAVVSRVEINYMQAIVQPTVCVHTHLEDEFDLEETNFKIGFRQHITSSEDNNAPALIKARIEVALLDRQTGLLTSIQDYLQPPH